MGAMGMSVTAAEVNIDEFSTAQCLDLAELVWDSLLPRDGIAVWQLEEIDRRRAELRSNPGIAIPFEQFRDRLLTGRQRAATDHRLSEQDPAPTVVVPSEVFTEALESQGEPSRARWSSGFHIRMDDLSRAERQELLRRLNDRLALDEPVVEIPDWHIQELERRCAEADTNPSIGIPWEEFKARFLARK